MAIVTINVDTEKQTLKATLDNKNIPDISDVRIYKYIPYSLDDGRINNENKEFVKVEIVSGKKDEESGINRTIITTCANDNIETNDKIAQDLAKAFKII